MKNLFILLLLGTNLFSLATEKVNCLDINATLHECALEKSLKKEPSLYKKLLSLDYMQSKVSRKILIFSSNLDYTMSQWLINDNSVSSKMLLQDINEEKDAYRFYSLVGLYDKFFKEETYLNTTQKNYIRMRFGVEENIKQEFNYLSNIRASFKLPKTKELLHLVIGEDEDESSESINEVVLDRTISVGVKYFFSSLDIFNANLHVGFRGIDNPLARVRLEYPIAFKNLLFRPVQYVEYSEEDRFKEETKLYFDYLLTDNNDLLRLSLSRYTQTDIKGMNYFGQLSYLKTTKYDIGFQIYANLSGRTKLTGTEPINEEYNTVPVTGVYNYKSGIIWKQQFFKEYLFYELHPIVEFAQEYDYNVNYILRANIELYFGNI